MAGIAPHRARPGELARPAPVRGRAPSVAAVATALAIGLVADAAVAALPAGAGIATATRDTMGDTTRAGGADRPRCRLRLSEHRSGRRLGSFRLAPPAADRHDAPPADFAIAFEHSVLGTTVIDRYRVDGARVVLVEERFAGEGYGLPEAAHGAQRMRRDGGERRRLLLERPVEPLIVRASAEQRTRLLVAGEVVPLVRLGASAVRIEPLDCIAAASAAAPLERGVRASPGGRR